MSQRSGSNLAPILLSDTSEHNLHCRFPDASSGSEFFSKLAAGVDMVSDDERKWKHFMHPDVPKRCGKFKPGELASFDAQFFGVHGQQAKVCSWFLLARCSAWACIDAGTSLLHAPPEPDSNAASTLGAAAA